MHQLRLLAGSTNDAHDRVIGKSARAANSSQAAAFAMGLQYLSNLFWRDLAMVVQGVKAFIESLLALRTEISLIAVRSFAMFMCAGVSTEFAFHRSCLRVGASLLYRTHHILMHY